jgi:hypothetical protein
VYSTAQLECLVSSRRAVVVVKRRICTVLLHEVERAGRAEGENAETKEFGDLNRKEADRGGASVYDELFSSEGFRRTVLPIDPTLVYRRLKASGRV